LCLDTQRVQCGIFSATFPPEALDIANKLLRNPTKIIVKREELTLAGIRQYYVDCEEDRHKLGVLCDIYNEISVSQSVIFVNSRRTADWLTDHMLKNEFPVACTHSGLNAKERSKVMTDFRRGSVRVLIATDLLARGIDVQQISVVINYDLPFDPEKYLHRIGRSGRFGRKGTAISFTTHKDIRLLGELERHYDILIPHLPKNLEDIIK